MRRLAVAAISVVALGTGIVFLLSAPAERRAPAAPVLVEPVAAYAAPLRLVVRSGDTLESLCRELAPADWVAWRNALLGAMKARDLRPAMTVLARRTAGGDLKEMSLRLDLRTSIVAARDGRAVTARRVSRPVEHRLARVSGTIASSLFGAVEAAGERPELAVRLAEIFRWDVDFFRDLRKGDSFVVLVDREEVDGAFYRYGTIFAARFINGRRVLNAVIFRGTGGRLGYYDLAGHPLRKQFLRAPLKFSRITSRFSFHRYHPILHRRMPHYGVDYGAPVGTPVHVTADGVVRFVGRRGGAGRMITVRHANGYETNYLHLSRYARGIRRGVRVRQGQVIGYVGQSGLATGPHLDYRVRLHGRWINPLRITSPPAPPIPRRLLDRYRNYARSVELLLEGKEAPAGARC